LRDDGFLESFAMSEEIDFDIRAAAILRMLIYPIQFDPDPSNGIDRVFTHVVLAEHLKLSRPEVIAAIDAGLASHTRLSELIPQSHSELVIRGFLTEVRARLETEQRTC
jgi:hypothetical protein